MKTILALFIIGLLGVTIAGAADRPPAEIVDYGVYTGGQNQSIPDVNAPTGQVLKERGMLKLEKQTTRIPAQLGEQFGFRFVIHGKSAGGDIKLHYVWLYPEMTDAASGKKSRQYEADGHGQPGDKSAGMMWTFTGPAELVPGEWIFQVFRDGAKILEQKFEVEKADGK
jgi:hypothetical protein